MRRRAVHWTLYYGAESVCKSEDCGFKATMDDFVDGNRTQRAKWDLLRRKAREHFNETGHEIRIYAETCHMIEEAQPVGATMTINGRIPTDQPHNERGEE